MPLTPTHFRSMLSSTSSRSTGRLDGMLLRDEVIRPWAKDPDIYSSGITNDAYVMISRTFAPPEQRLKSLIARLKLMPNALAEARKNLDNPPRVYTEIAIEQLDGNRDFFASDVPAAFAEVKDASAARRVQDRQRRRHRRARGLQEVAARTTC